jgi:hypothetical protein
MKPIFRASVAFLLITTSKLKGLWGPWKAVYICLDLCLFPRKVHAPVPWLRLHVRLRLLAPDKLMKGVGRSVFRILLRAADRQALQRRRIMIGPAYAGTDTLPTNH